MCHGETWVLGKWMVSENSAINHLVASIFCTHHLNGFIDQLMHWHSVHSPKNTGGGGKDGVRPGCLPVIVLTFFTLFSSKSLLLFSHFLILVLIPPPLHSFQFFSLSPLHSSHEQGIQFQILWLYYGTTGDEELNPHWPGYLSRTL